MNGAVCKEKLIEYHKLLNEVIPDGNVLGLGIKFGNIY